MIVPQDKNLFIRLRDYLWMYPYRLFDRKGTVSYFIVLYNMTRPFSHMFVFSMIFLVIGSTICLHPLSLVKPQSVTLIEGVITGTGTLSRINPLVPTNKQLETDLSGLIYLPLVRVNPYGEVQSVLAVSWESIDGEDNTYEFHLRDDVFWHDGRKFTADDVIATFNVLKALGGKEKSIVSKHAELAQGLEIVKVDNYTILFELEDILPTFFEDVSFGILPRHVLDQVSLSTFTWADFNLHPIGTGPFVFESLKDNIVTLVSNASFFARKPEIERIEIMMFQTGDEAVEALKNGSIHILTDPSTAVLNELASWTNIKEFKSTVLYRRYQAIYFNLRAEGSVLFQDKRVRQAISSAVDRENLVRDITTAGEEAMGPIPKNSWAYNPEVEGFRYNPPRAKELLEEAGWEQKEVEGKIVRMKQDEILRFDLSYLDKYDRQLVAESIKSDLGRLGIIVNLDPQSSSDLNEALIATRNFEAVLYGVETPIDPDRIRLWHNKAIEYPGLNISSYTSEKRGAIISESKELDRVSLVDAALENGRKSMDHAKRNGAKGLSIGYLEFQTILLEECPAVFLYHPVFTYVAHSRINGINLSEMTAPEERYLSITDWSIDM